MGLADGLAATCGGERIHHREELKRAAANLARAIPGIEIEGYFVDFEGVWATDLELASAGAM